ncbi:HD domain-containing protein [Acidiferrimicrobium sp. IK]|uniref:HD domain-containing protein n=1 Tax=Acidiferrimicrobium sp. IK TaxID=2871700 RepID=UPI0021CB8C6F|nr:HD domain-containing protein [Acidiferrimicrobium sp. IK]MCU4186585.1 HD domain-containing protein [Acidiferrimicrobium sp. IK]
MLRRNLITDGSRRETDAEHQWHVALMALLLAEHAAEPVDVLRVATMLLVHDLVEIDAGDAYLYDAAARESARALEDAAAERVFGVLPADQGGWLRGLWEEFEAGESADARFALALDRIQPLLLNAASGGEAWRTNGVTARRVEELVIPRIEPGSPALHAAARALVALAVDDGIIAP